MFIYLLVLVEHACLTDEQECPLRYSSQYTHKHIRRLQCPTMNKADAGKISLSKLIYIIYHDSWPWRLSLVLLTYEPFDRDKSVGQ